MHKLNLALTPTPLEKLENLSHDLDINLWIKRDDLTGDILTGGNKIRKLEYILADAIKQGADTIITTGGLQSNHVKATATLAIKLGLKPILLLNGVEPTIKKGNLFLDDLMDVETHYIQANNQQEMNLGVAKLAEGLKLAGKKPYVIPVGGSTGLGSLGYVDAYQELISQCQEKDLNFDWIFVSAGSGGTISGIFMGHLQHQSTSKIVGISPWLLEDELKSQILKCINDGQKILGNQEVLTINEMQIDDHFIGDGYGIPTVAGMNALKLLAKKEGIILDQVYTAKAMAGLLDYVEKGIIPAESSVLFWHTGGAPGLFNL